jgi:hypothetical protein
MLSGELVALEKLLYVKEVFHFEITKEEYEEHRAYGAEPAQEKKSEGKKSGLKFSSLENFFVEENEVSHKGGPKKSRKK